jgi:hypothetical protein
MSGRNFPGGETALKFRLYASAQLDCSNAAGEAVQMGDEEVYGLCNRSSVRSQPLGGGYGLDPIYRREGDLRAVGLNLRIAIRSSSFRLFLRFKPKLDSLLAGKTGDVPVPVSKRFFPIFYREEEGAVAWHNLLLPLILQKR